jgi:LCP family protein required for cell wall assembly
MQTLFTTGLVVLFLMLAGIAGLFVFDQVRQYIAASDILPPFTVGESSGTPEVSFQLGEPLPVWEGTDRVNILVMGIDQRANEDGPWRTDSMMVLTIDPVTMNAGVLSIPRDLWVPIPGYGEDRINKANFLGDADDYPGGGPALAADTVEYNLGVRIHHYARINFDAFVELVDRIGGIDICVEKEINDPSYPGPNYDYDPLYIPAGCQHFDGEMALKYARTRHSGGGDFDRAKRQQQVIRAVFKQVTQLELLPQLAPQASELWTMLQDSVVTDPGLTLDKIVALANLASQVRPEDIRYGVIDENYTQFWKTPDDQQVLIPLRDRIRELRDYIFTDAPAPASNEPAARLAAEAATIEVLNGTATEGLAGRTTTFLQQQGVQVMRTDNADRSDYAESLIIVYTGKNYTAEYLDRLLNLPPTAVVHGANPNAAYDISVILGADYQPPAQ